MHSSPAESEIQSRLRRGIAALGMIAALWLAGSGHAPQAADAPAAMASPAGAALLMGFDEDPRTFGSAWSLRVYAEAFKRLGIAWKPVFVPLARRTVLADEGLIDGDGARVHDYQLGHPALIRVEEPILELTFGLYTADPRVKLHRLEELASSNYMVEYRRGIYLCETTLAGSVATDNLSNVSSELQGLKKLLAGRTDLYCEIDVVVRQTLNMPEFKEAAGRVRKVIGVGGRATYPYLHKKHAALVPRLAEVLHQMRAEGLIEAYRLEAERESGVSQ